MKTDCTAFHLKQLEHDAIERQIEEFLADPKNEIKTFRRGESGVDYSYTQLSKYQAHRRKKIQRALDDEPTQEES